MNKPKQFDVVKMSDSEDKFAIYYIDDEIVRLVSGLFDFRDFYYKDFINLLERGVWEFTTIR